MSCIIHKDCTRLPAHAYFSKDGSREMAAVFTELRGRVVSGVWHSFLLTTSQVDQPFKFLCDNGKRCNEEESQLESAKCDYSSLFMN